MCIRDRFPADFPTLQPRHHHVEQHEIGLARAGQFQRAYAVAGGHDLRAAITAVFTSSDFVRF